MMAHPFDEEQGRLRGNAVPIAEGVDNDTINGRAAFSASTNGVLIYRTGPATGGPSPDVVGPRRQNWAPPRRSFYRYLRVSPDGRTWW